MHTKNQISLTRKTLYGIMLLGVFFSAFGGGNLTSVRAQEGAMDVPAGKTSYITYTNDSQGYKIDYPNSWYIYPYGVPGDYSNLNQLLLSTVSLIPNDDGEYPVAASNGSTIVIGLNSTAYSANDQSLKNFVETYLISPFFKPPSKEIQVGNLKFIELDGELGRLLFISNGPNVFSAFMPISNLDADQSIINSIISSLEFTRIQKVITSIDETPNSIPIVLYESQRGEISSQAVPSMKMPWDISLSFNYNSGPHGNGDVNYSACNPYVLSSLAGIDFSLRSTNEVLAAAGGTVTYYYEGTNSNYGVGQYVQIDHGGGWKTQYWHLSSIDQWVKDNLNVSNAVQQGQVLGKAGKTGGQNAEHLHFQLKDANGPYGWDGVSIDGYVVRSIIDATDTSRGLNYQGTLTKGNETLGSTFSYPCGSVTRQAKKWSGSSGTITAVGGPVYSSNSRKNGGTPGGSLNPPTLLSPSQGQTLTSRSVHFTWQSPNATNQNGYTFRLSVNSNPDTQPWLVDTGLGNEYSSYDYNFNADGTYYWHMRTWNISNQASNWVTRSFVINTSGGGGNNPPAGFTWCADEDGHCSFSGTADVVYGAVNSFTSPRSFTNGTDCNNGIFGDPISGTRKACYYKLTSPPPSGNLHVEYFNDKNLGGRCYDGYENSTYVFKNWGSGSPASGCNSDNFSARFTGTYNFSGGSYSFHCQHDDGCRIFIDGQLKLDAWWDSSFTGHDWGGSLSGNHEVKIEFYDSGGDARLEAFWSGAGYLPSGPSCTSGEWCGQYFGNKDLAGTPAVQRNEGNTNINYTWNDGGIGFGFPNDNFSARWQRNVYFAAGRYRFHIKTDDGGRLWVNNSQVINQWKDQGATEYTVDLDLGTGEIPLKFEYYENGGGAIAQMWWDTLQLYVPPSANFDAWPQSGNAPFTSTMHIVDTSNITSCSWDYGDGQTGTSCASTHDHIYNNAGIYTVSLTVNGPGGSDTLTLTDYITVSAAPATPANFIVSGATVSSLTLNWQDNSTNETGFNIYRWGYDGAQWTFIYLASVGANTTSYTQTGLDCGSDFNFYELSAYNANGESPHIGWIQGTTNACPASDLTVTNISFSPASPFTNEDVWVSVDVTNFSGNDAPGFWVDFYIDDTPTGCADWGSYYYYSSGLAANTTQTWWLRLPANSLTSGAHQFRAYADSGCEVTESDKTNNISNTTAFTLTVPASLPPAHDDLDTTRLISSLAYTDTVDVSGATTAWDDPYIPDCGGYGLVPGMTSVWYQYTPSSNISLSLDTIGSGYDIYIAVWTGSRGNLSPVACNDDIDTAGHNYQSSLQVSLNAGTTYYFEVAQFSDSYPLAAASTATGESNIELPPGTWIDPRLSGAGILAVQSIPSQKPTSDVGAQAGGMLQFHVSEITGAYQIFLPLVIR